MEDNSADPVELEQLRKDIASFNPDTISKTYNEASDDLIDKTREYEIEFAKEYAKAKDTEKTTEGRAQAEATIQTEQKRKDLDEAKKKFRSATINREDFYAKHSALKKALGFEEARLRIFNE